MLPQGIKVLPEGTIEKKEVVALSASEEKFWGPMGWVTFTFLPVCAPMSSWEPSLQN